MTTEFEHRGVLHEIMRSYRRAQVLITCAELRIFEHLASGSQSANELAEKTGTEPRALERLLNAAAGLGFLTKDNGVFANAPVAAACLVEGSSYYMGNTLRREGAFLQRWTYLTEAVRTGKRPEPNQRDERQDNWVKTFELALLDSARVAAPAIAEALDLPEDQPVKVLDVGGGHGGYSMALARRYPQAEAMVYELPEPAEVAREIIAGEGMADRVGVMDGDFQKEDLPAGYDVHLLFGVLVSETPDGKLALLRKSYAALNPGGRVVIRGFWLDDDRAGPAEATLTSLHMLLSTQAGDISAANEMFDLLRQAGFANAHEVALPEHVGSNLLAATKPAG